MSTEQEIPTQLTPATFNSAVEFDLPFKIHDDQTMTPVRDLYSPDVYEDDANGIYIDSSLKWRFVNGFSGQDRYTGPVMHSSEFFGGKLAQHVLETPGVYVLTTVTYTDRDGYEDLSGWVVLELDQ